MILLINIVLFLKISRITKDEDCLIKCYDEHDVFLLSFLFILLFSQYYNENLNNFLFFVLISRI